jgi:hypothetical protein
MFLRMQSVRGQTGAENVCVVFNFSRPPEWGERVVEIGWLPHMIPP